MSDKKTTIYLYRHVDSSESKEHEVLIIINNNQKIYEKLKK